MSEVVAAATLESPVSPGASAHQPRSRANMTAQTMSAPPIRIINDAIKIMRGSLFCRSAFFFMYSVYTVARREGVEPSVSRVKAE